MANKLDLRKSAFWFKQTGPENDVVISSRIRLGRNLTGFAFPQNLTYEQEKAVMEKIVPAFNPLVDESDYTLFRLEDMNPLDIKLLLERNIITQDFSLAKNKCIVFNADGTMTALVNETDHLKIAALKGGFSLKEAYKAVNELDSILEQKLDFAVSMEWGYLGPYLTNIGTQMRASLMVHLPALVMTDLVTKAIKTIASFGLSIKGFFDDGEESLGDMYQISNQISLGASENDIIESLEEIVLQLVNYERRAREEMLEKEPIMIKDKIGRAVGMLLYAKRISSKEAINLLSLIRLGIALEIIKGVSFETITALLFLSQKYHIQTVLGNIDEIDSKLIDYTRAKLIRESLQRVELSGGE
ncbi:MAG: hypothetical protein JW904_03430 [Spirochaetales bacterium]|nr:hypothetical protein [Spirochaetales bacterium]